MNKLGETIAKFFNSRKNVRLSLLVLVAIISGLGLYLNLDKLNRQASENPIGPIENQATLTYRDSQGILKDIASNTVTTSIVNPPAQATFNFNKEGWYLFALSQKPANPRAESVFHYNCEGGGGGGEPYPTEMSIDGNLYTWNNFNGGLKIWDGWSECGMPTVPNETFGDMDTGRGYWVDTRDGNTGTITYATVPETGPKIVDVSKAGWAMIGNPFTRPLHIDNAVDIRFSKAGVEGDKSWEEAVSANWIETNGYKWENDGLMDFGCTSDVCWASNDLLDVNQGGWILLKVDGISIKFTP